MKLLLDVQGAQGSSRHSGLGRYTRELALAIAAAPGGHEVHLLLNGAFSDAAAELEDSFAPLLGAGRIHRFHPPAESHAGGEPYRPARLAAEWLRAQAVQRIAPDLLHIGSLFEGWNESLVTTWPACLARPRSAATLHDLIPLSFAADYIEGAWRRAGLVPWYWRHVLELQQLDLLLCNSEATRQEGLRHLPVPPERLVTIGGGVPAHFLGDAPGPGPVPGRYVLCVGLGDLRKNEVRLLAAMALLPDSLRADLRLVVTGKGDPAAFLAMARRAGLAADAVLHLGVVPDAAMPALYQGAVCCVVPSLTEGFGLPAVEAMSRGTPVIASRAGALPEVVGRDDALFDPLDAADIARVLGRVLGDAGFAAALRAHALASAPRFSWPRVAARAWPSLERAAGPAHAPRPSLAVTGPLPPEASGIADYSAELLPALARHYAITLVSERRPLAGLVAGFPWLSTAEFAARAWRFDRVLHHLGNSHLHHAQYTRLLGLRPACGVLHDVALPEYRRWATRDDPAALLAALYANHGYPALLAALAGDAAMVAQSCLLSAEVVSGLLGTIVHSQAACELLRAQHGEPLLTRTHLVPHLRRVVALPERAQARARLGLAADALVVTSFGACLPKKWPQRVVAGFAAVGLPASAMLVFAGGFQPGLDQVLASEARARGLSDRVQLTGPLERALYEDWLAASDIAVQLRSRHQGESSGAVADAMAAGLPCIVNAAGSLAELPEDAVLRLPADLSDAALAGAMTELAQDAARRAALGARAREWVAQALAPDRIAAQYRDAIEASHADAPALSLLRAVAAGAVMPVADALSLAAVLDVDHPLPRQARLWVSAVAGRARAIFVDAHAGRRPEPVRWQDGLWVSDHACLAAALGLKHPAAPDGPVYPRAGDAVMLGRDEPVPASLRRSGLPVIRPA